jgi:hypothetical protein
MQLRELTNVNALNAAQTQTIKGGARDTRTGGTSGISAFTLPIKN